MSESNKNPILNWSWEKPTEEGLYLACRGDVETEANIEAINIFILGGELMVYQHPEAPVSSWPSSFKFAKLCIGKEAQS